MPAVFERQMIGGRVHHHELAVWALMSPGTTLPALSIGVCPLQKIRPGTFTACAKANWLVSYQCDSFEFIQYIGTSILSGLLIF